MTIDNQEQLAQWLDELYDYEAAKKAFAEMDDKPYPSRQVCAIVFLQQKLKDECKQQAFFLHGEHDVLFIGSSFDIFQDFTKEDAMKCIAFDIGFSEDGDGFQIYASM